MTLQTPTRFADSIVKQVLVVDDNKDLRESLAFVLEWRGYSVELAENGHEALRKLRDGPRPCLVILDLRMPVMSGWDCRAAMLEDEALASIPVVIMSAYTHVQSEIEKLYAAAYLQKPAGIRDLFGVIEQFC